MRGIIVIALCEPWLHRDRLLRVAVPPQLLTANCSFIEITSLIAVSSRPLSANHSIIAIAFCKLRYQYDRYPQVAVSLRSPFADRRINAIAISKLQFHRDHLTDCGIIEIAISESRLHRDGFLGIAVSTQLLSVNRGIHAIAFRESRYHCDCSQQIVVSS